LNKDTNGVKKPDKEKDFQKHKLIFQRRRDQRKVKNQTIRFFKDNLNIHTWLLVVVMILGNLQASYARYPFLLTFKNIQIISWQDFRKKNYFRKATKQKYEIFDKYLLATIYYGEETVNQVFRMNLPPSTSQTEILQIIRKTIVNSSTEKNKYSRDQIFIEGTPSFLRKMESPVLKQNFHFLKEEKKKNFENLEKLQPAIGYVFFSNEPEYVFRGFVFQGTNLLYFYVALFPFWLVLQIMAKLEEKKKNSKLTKAILKKPFQNKKRLKDLAGIEKIQPDLKELVHSLKSSQLLYSPFISTRPMPKGYLFVGPPGTGKTLLAQAIAGTAGVNLFATVASEFLDGQKGIGCARLRDLFIKAKKASPAILFIDEIDTLGKTREGTINSLSQGNSKEEKIQIFTEFLVQLDGFSKQEKVVVIGATNFSSSLDPAFIRPGRFDRLFQLEHPHQRARTAILKLHVDRQNLKRGETFINWGRLAQLTVGFTGADLAAMVNESLLYAIRTNKKAIHNTKTLEHGFYRIATYSQPKKIQNSIWENQQELFSETRKAYHQASKQLFAIYFKKSFQNYLKPPILFLENRPKNPRYQKLENEGKKTQFEVLPKKYLKIELIKCLIGVAAEFYLLERFSLKPNEMIKKPVQKNNLFWLSHQGENDLQEASHLVSEMIHQYGMIDDEIFFQKTRLDHSSFLGSQTGNWENFWIFFQNEFTNYFMEENDKPIQMNWRFFKSWSWLETNQIYSQRRNLPWDESILDEKKQENKESISPDLFYRSMNLEIGNKNLQEKYDHLLRSHLTTAFYEANSMIKKDSGRLDFIAHQLLLKTVKNE
tara:strand:+ start:69 stop:2537 length:2469 start_codon:yes stop_codon:yes gene_type:complete